MCQSLDLQRLAMAAQATVIGSRANSTTKKYWAAFKCWKDWAKFHDLWNFPIKEAHLMLYMQSVGECTRSKSAVEEVYNALAWAHRIGWWSAVTYRVCSSKTHTSRSAEATGKTNPEEKANHSWNFGCNFHRCWAIQLTSWCSSGDSLPNKLCRFPAFWRSSTNKSPGDPHIWQPYNYFYTKEQDRPTLQW